MEKSKNNAQPQAENSVDAYYDEQTDEILIPIKFNKEEKMLSVSQAAELAQKGMKFDILSDTLNELKAMSKERGKSVTQFIKDIKSGLSQKRLAELSEQCGGNAEMAEHILKLEAKDETADLLGFDELKQSFPEIKTPEQLPDRVLEAAQLKGTLLLDEYLRYLLSEKQRADEAVKQERQNKLLSTGSQLNKKGRISPVTAEFLKGLWK